MTALIYGAYGYTGELIAREAVDRGLDVVPTDCLAAHLHDRLPTGTQLRLGIDTPGSVSGGTLATVFEQLGMGGMVRRNGRLQSESPGANANHRLWDRPDPRRQRADW